MNTANALVPDAVYEAPHPLDAFAPVAGMLGIDLEALKAMMVVDPDAPQPGDLAEAVDELRAEVRALTDALAPVFRVCELIEANSGKLRVFGIKT
jgi:hypothetical protein